MEGEKIFTYQEAALYAHVSTRTIIRWVKMGKIKAKYIFGRNPRISMTSLKWAIEHMPTVKESRQRNPVLLSLRSQGSGTREGSDANSRRD